MLARAERGKASIPLLSKIDNFRCINTLELSSAAPGVPTLSATLMSSTRIVAVIVPLTMVAD